MMLLAGYGGMVSARADDDRRRRRLHGRDLRHQQHEHSRLRLAVVGCWCRSRCCSRPPCRALIGAISVRTEGIYTIMITLAIARGVLLFRAAELHAVQRPFAALPAFAAPRVFGIDWRDPRAVLLSLSAASRRPAMPPCSTARARRSASRCRRSATTAAAHARARVSTSPAHKVVAYFCLRHHRRLGRRAAGLVQRPHIAGHGRRRRR